MNALLRAIAVALAIGVAGCATTASPEKPQSAPSKAAHAVVDEVRRYGSDLKAIAVSPAGWDHDQWERIGWGTAGFAGIVATDQQVSDWFQEHRNDTTDNIAQFATPFGGGRGLQIAGLILLGGLVADKPEIRDTGRDAIEA